MALQIRSRFKPDINRSPHQTTIANADYEAVTGTIIRPVQIVAYDDTEYNAATAIPGDPTSERYLTIMEESTLQFDLSAATSATNAQVTAFLENALDAWALSIKPSGATILKIVNGSRKVGLRPIP